MPHRSSKPYARPTRISWREPCQCSGDNNSFNNNTNNNNNSYNSPNTPNTNNCNTMPPLSNNNLNNRIILQAHYPPRAPQGDMAS